MKENDTLRPPLKAIYLVPQSMITITEEGLRLRVGETLSAYKARAELTAKLIGSLTFFCICFAVFFSNVGIPKFFVSIQRLDSVLLVLLGLFPFSLGLLCCAIFQNKKA